MNCIVQAQTQAPAVAQSQKGVIVNEEATVFQDADFDSQVITTLKPGDVYDISVNKKGAFYKIRVKPGTLGFISDSDIRPQNGQTKAIVAEKKKTEKIKKAQESAVAGKKSKSLLAARYRGPVIDMINYAEDTMGSVKNESLLFYGMKWSGYNTMFDGEMYTDASLLFHYGAPTYYQTATTNTASGWILIANFLFETALPQSKTHMIYYGFGPTYRYSHYSVSLKNSLTATNPTNTDYALDDMTLGAVFNVGMAFRIANKFDLRTDVRYYWETQRYTSLGASFQWEF